MVMSETLVGVWNLSSAEEEVHPDGRISHPFGSFRRGRLIYSPDGYMNALVTPLERRQIPTMLSPWAYEGASLEDIAGLVSNCIAYSGPFKIVGTAVHHQVDASINPILVGQTLVREIALQGRALTLTGPVNDQGTFLRIHWQR